MVSSFGREFESLQLHFLDFRESDKNLKDLQINAIVDL